MNPSVDPPASPEEAELRRLLEEVRAGRILSEDALPQIERLRQIVADRAASSAAQSTTRPAASSNAGFWIVGLVFSLTGGVFAAVGIGFGWNSRSFEVDTQRAEGVVVSFKHEKKTSKPIVRYTVGGKEFTVVGRVGSKPSPYQLGDRIGVLYKVAAPEMAQIDSFTERWLFPVIFGGVGGLFCLSGLGMLVYRLLKLRGAAAATPA